MLNFLEKLNILMKVHGLNKHSFATKCGIPYTTVDAFYKKGYDNVKLSTIRKISSFFGITLDYLMDDDVMDVDYGKSDSLTLKATETGDERLNNIIDIYNDMNEEGRDKLETYANDLIGSPRHKKESQLELGAKEA